MEIESERLMLKEIIWEDMEDYHRFCSLPEVREFSTLSIPKDISETKERLQSIIDDQIEKPRKSYNWKVLLKGSENVIGLAGITLSLDRFNLGEIYFEVDPAFWGNGYATEVSKTLIRIGFEDFHLHKVEAGVATENIRSIKVLGKSGMTREGLRRKILPICGEWKDNYHYAIVEDDPRK